MIRFYFFIGLLLLTVPVAAQQSDDILDAVNELLYDSRYQEAIDLTERANHSDPIIRFRLSLKKSEALIRSGKLEEASTQLQQIADGSVTDLSDEVKRGLVQTLTGFLELNRGRNDLAEKQLEEAQHLLQPSGQPLDQAQCLTYLALVYWSSGKYIQAEENQLMALSLRKDNLPDNHELIAATYNDLGLIYGQIDTEKAIDYYTMATDIYAELHGNNHPKLAITNTNLGLAYLNIQLYGDAIVYFETALTIWNSIYPGDHPSKALVLTNLGRTYSRIGDSAAAMRFYEQSLAMYRAVYGTRHPDIASTLNIIGNQLLSNRQAEHALTHFQDALIANSVTFKSSEIKDNPNDGQYYNGIVMLYSLMYKAQALEALHFNKTLRQRDLELAITSLRITDQLIDQLRQQSTNESDKIALGVIANEVYADGVRISTLLSHSSFKGRDNYRELSFYFAEKSKSAVLLDAISDTRAKSFAGIPEEVLEEESRLKAEQALINEKLAEMPSAAEQQALRERSFEVNQRYQLFVRQLEISYPEYFNLKFNTTSPSIKLLQEKLDKQTAIVSYFVDEKNKRLYQYAITSKRVRLTDTALPNDFDRYITGLRNSLYFMSDEVYALTGRELYNVLKPAVPKPIRELIILPTGRLSVIPFEALLTKKIKTNQFNYQTLPYLLRDFSVRYEFSAGLILQQAVKNESTTLSSALLLAPVYFTGNNTMNDLPGTEREINTISQLLSNKNIPVQVLMKEEADKQTFQHALQKQHSLIHLAPHTESLTKIHRNSQEFIFMRIPEKQQTTSTPEKSIILNSIQNLLHYQPAKQDWGRFPGARE